MSHMQTGDHELSENSGEYTDDLDEAASREEKGNGE